MLDNCKPEDIDYTKPIIIKWWQSNGYYRINKYELVGDVVKWFTLVVCNDINIPELEFFREYLKHSIAEHIQDNLYWQMYSVTEGTKQELEYMLNHPSNKCVLATNLNRHTYD